MKFQLNLIVVAILLFFLGCAGTNPLSRDLSNAEDFSDKKDWENAYRHLENPLGRSDYKEKALELIKKYPSIVSTGVGKSFMTNLTRLEVSCSEHDIDELFMRLAILKNVGIVNNNAQSDIVSKCATVINKCVCAESSIIMLESLNLWIDRLGEDLFTIEAKSKAFKRQVDSSVKAPDNFDENIIKHINRFNDAKPYAEAKLPEILWMGNSKATQTVKTLFPQYYDAVYKSSGIIINVTTEPKKPLLEMDITKELGQYIMISAYQDNSKANYTIVVRELAYEEQNIPEQTVQKYVSYMAMNAVNAVLCYPRNATAIYDVTTGGLIIRYAYQIDLLANGQKIESVTLRDSVTNTYTRVSNLRYQNVFGGVGVPICYPNAAVEQEFKSNSSPVSIESTREEVLEKVLRKITELEHIKKAALFGKK